MQEFLRRRSDLAPQSRMRLANDMAGALKQRLGLPAGGDNELFSKTLCASTAFITSHARIR
ncbi:hypothetical protein HC891_26660 [Candidatus Gracilibacteria bacterium]|nr:hypothetical protein [Candidatus Gracilibacteria bacterium]